MRVFVTGGTGLIGSAIVAELLGNDHTVLALARSDSSATVLQTAGAQTIRGDLADPGALRAGAAKADGVIHLAFANDFSSPAALAALGEELIGSGRPLITVSGTPLSQAAPRPRRTCCPPTGRSAAAAGLSRRFWTWPRGVSGARPAACRARSTTKAGADSPAC